MLNTSRSCSFAACTGAYEVDLSQKRVSFIRFYVLFLLVYFLVFIGNGPSVRSCSF